MDYYETKSCLHITGTWNRITHVNQILYKPHEKNNSDRSNSSQWHNVYMLLKQSALVSAQHKHINVLSRRLHIFIIWCHFASFGLSFTACFSAEAEPFIICGRTCFIIYNGRPGPINFNIPHPWYITITIQTTKQIEAQPGCRIFVRDQWSGKDWWFYDFCCNGGKCWTFYTQRGDVSTYKVCIRTTSVPMFGVWTRVEKLSKV